MSDAGDEFQVGTTVFVYGKLKGVVRHIGEVSFAAGVQVGVELDSPQGDCDGEKGGVRYFTCKPRHGVFVEPDDVVAAGEANKAASAVQSVSRKLLARRKASKERNSKVWNKLDNMNEQLAIKRSLQLQSIFGGEQNSARDVSGAEPQVEVEEDYDGPTLQLPLQEDMVLDMLEHFKQNRILHLKYAFMLLKVARDIFSKEATLQECRIEEGQRMTVVGDIHGQLQDLFSIFTINGLPATTNQYLFNGDFVDRGRNGAEVLFSILAFKVLYPDCVRLNRGNHESRQQNRLMGFEEEMLAKYPGPHGRSLLMKCHDIFDVLPLCALIQEKIFVVHGGLFPHDGVTFDHIRGMSRKREPPIHSPAFEDQLFEAMLWSDPRAISGRQLSARGAGVEFGQDVTHEFLRTNHAALVIRSHECVREGFELLHSGRLITLFSASRYCGLQTNKGAFLTIGPELQPEIQQFFAHSVAETHWDAPESQKEIEQRLEDDTVQMIIERLIDAKPSLYWHYTRQDKDKSGKITRLQWANGLKLVLQLDVPFLSYLERMVDLEEDGTVNYTKFLERYRVQVAGLNADMWADAIIDKICEKMFVAMGAGNVADAFKYFDDDGNGLIEYEEFINSLKRLDIGLSDNQMFELMRGLDKDCDSMIDLEEFASRFELVFVRLGPSLQAKLPGGGASGAVGKLNGADKDNMHKTAKHVYKAWGSVEAAFAAIDHAGKGSCTYEELADTLIAKGVEVDRPSLLSLAAAIDANRDKVIDKAEFTSAFKVTDRRGSLGRKSSGGATEDQLALAAQAVESMSNAAGGNHPGPDRGASGSSVGSSIGSAGGRLMQDVGWQEGVIQQIANFMYQNRHQLASTFRSFDIDNDGVIDTQEFHTGMHQMNKLFNQPLTDDQISAIMDALDKDKDGTLSYKEFLEGFSIVDTKHTPTNTTASSVPVSPSST